MGAAKALIVMTGIPYAAVYLVAHDLLLAYFALSAVSHEHIVK
jgi:type IV secretory pathway TrbD component